MKQRQHIFQSWAIEVIMVLLASTISFPVSDTLGVQLSILPFVMVACYVALKFIYHLCLSLSAHIISLPSLFRHKPTQSDRLTKDDCNLATAISMVDNDDIQMKRMELFHYEYQHEERQYLQQYSIMSTSMRNGSIFNRKKEKKMKSYKPYCNTPGIHSGSLTLVKKKSFKSAYVFGILSPIGKLFRPQASASNDVFLLPKSH